MASNEKEQMKAGAKSTGKNGAAARGANDDAVLTPMGAVPEGDAWLYKNPQALDLFRQGLADAAAGNVTAGEDFSHYANEAI